MIYFAIFTSYRIKELYLSSGRISVKSRYFLRSVACMSASPVNKHQAVEKASGACVRYFGFTQEHVGLVYRYANYLRIFRGTKKRFWKDTFMNFFLSTGSKLWFQVTQWTTRQCKGGRGRGGMEFQISHDVLRLFYRLFSSSTVINGNCGSISIWASGDYGPRPWIKTSSTKQCYSVAFVWMVT